MGLVLVADASETNRLLPVEEDREQFLAPDDTESP
jgi:hypothetical protein